jgi:hypothetical protein
MKKEGVFGFHSSKNIRHILTFESCINNCFVFACSKDMASLQCPVCKTTRYTQEACPTCEPKAACSSMFSCNHTRTKHCPRKIFQYRPITSIVKLFLHYKHFIAPLQYRDLDEVKNVYHDVFSSDNWKLQSKLMQNHFERKYPILIEQEESDTLQPLNLVISIGYDGANRIKYGRYM